MTRLQLSYNMKACFVRHNPNSSSGFDLKAIEKTSITHQLLFLLLALLLFASNAAFSAHVSSHSANDSGLCSLCVHSDGPDTVIAHEPGTVFVSSIELDLTRDVTMTRVPAVDLFVHQSRAPPDLT